MPERAASSALTKAFRQPSVANGGAFPLLDRLSAFIPEIASMEGKSGRNAVHYHQRQQVAVRVSISPTSLPTTSRTTGSSSRYLSARGPGEWRQIDRLSSERADCSGPERRAAEGLKQPQGRQYQPQCYRKSPPRSYVPRTQLVMSHLR